MRVAKIAFCVLLLAMIMLKVHISHNVQLYLNVDCDVITAKQISEAKIISTIARAWNITIYQQCYLIICKYMITLNASFKLHFNATFAINITRATLIVMYYNYVLYRFRINNNTRIISFWV